MVNGGNERGHTLVIDENAISIGPFRYCYASYRCRQGERTDEFVASWLPRRCQFVHSRALRERAENVPVRCDRQTRRLLKRSVIMCVINEYAITASLQTHPTPQ